MPEFDYMEENGLYKVFHRKNRSEAIAVVKDNDWAEKICKALNGEIDLSDKTVDKLFSIGAA